MQTLSYGYLLPDTGNFGNEWFPALEQNIQRLNDHNHDGLNSIKLTSTSFVPVVQSVLTAAFVNISPGIFRATLTLLTGLTVDLSAITVRDPTTKEVIHLKTEKAGVGAYYLYTNEVQDYEVVILT